MNKYKELTIKVYLYKDIKVKDSYEKISRLLNYIMEKDKTLSEKHTIYSKFKGYSFSGMYPIEKDGIYKMNEIYQITLRAYDDCFANTLQEVATGEENEDMCIITIDSELCSSKEIIEMYTITPAVASIMTPKGKTVSWNTNMAQDIEEIIFKNLLKKYNFINGTNVLTTKEDVIESVDIVSKCAIVINYKGHKILGYKYKIVFKQNNIAQEIANCANVLGVLTKNSTLGCGFVKSIYKR